jgi:hypothetical protein
MTLDEVRLARKLLGRLVFQTMPTVLGQRFQVDRVEDFENSADHLPLVDLEGELKTQPRSITGTLMKYGFVDLRFSLTRHPHNIPPAGARVLASLLGEGGLDRTGEHQGDSRDRIEHLKSLCEQVDSGALELTVLAKGVQATLPLADSFPLSRGFTRVPDGFFPQEFEVTDAYITNAPDVGLSRNFYW